MRVLNTNEHNSLLVISENTTVLKNTQNNFFHMNCVREKSRHIFSICGNICNRSANIFRALENRNIIPICTLF